ncbi:acyl carrier protein [Nonomuraea sp. NPDC050394]|uniref:acyl carrier protein n=1 Tax=Nonomuraea sp. NPDC050394 TaxID=3364363 RepID=UPI0037B468FD
MTVEPITTVEDELLAHLTSRTKSFVTKDEDLFASGLVSSMFAMELVVHLESAYGVAVTGTDLQLDNFRSVETMAALVHRLREQQADA